MGKYAVRIPFHLVSFPSLVSLLVYI
jgi:hypothetical protein